MADLTPTPVKGMLRAFHRGTVLTKRICKAAQNGSAVELLNILEPAQALGKSFGASEARLRKAYEDSTKTFGRQFAEAILDDCE
jgi:SpoVK/Ycf46/Vps4 family AAA+-type ATPase